MGSGASYRSGRGEAGCGAQFGTVGELTEGTDMFWDELVGAHSATRPSGGLKSLGEALLVTVISAISTWTETSTLS